MVVDYFIHLKKSRFIRDVSMLTGGTAAAQVITIGLSPIITRLYGPEAFGILGVFTSFVMIIATISTLNYAHAIVLSSSENEAHVLINLSILVGIAITFIVTVVLVILNQIIADKLGIYEYATYLLLTPVIIISMVFDQIYEQLLIRKKRFRTISRVLLTQATLISASKCGIGLILPTAPVLLLLNVFSHMLRAILLWLGSKKIFPTKDHLSILLSLKPMGFLLIKDVAYKYRDFPLFRTPNYFLSAISQSIPIILLGSLIGPVSAGFYALSVKVMKLPIELISESVGKVFYPTISESAHRGENLKPLIIKATKMLLLIGFVPFGVITIFGPEVFALVFGEEWLTAGHYARWLSIWLFFWFIFTPCSRVVPILGLQGQQLLFTVTSIILRVLSLFIGVYFFKSDIGTIAVYSIVSALLEIGWHVWIIIRTDSTLRNDLGVIYHHEL